MPRWIKYTLVGIAAFLALAVIGLTILVHALDFNRYVRLAVEEVQRTTGREFRIGGELEVKVFPRLAIVAEDVAFGNAPWGSRAEMVKIKRIEGAIALLPLLHREISLVRLVAVEPDVLLETDAKGVGNWEFGPAPTKPAAADESAALSLDLRELAIDGGVLAYHDAATKGTVRLTVKRLALTEQSLVAEYDLNLDAAFRDQAFTINGTIGTIERVLAKDSAWPVNVALATDGAAGTIAGTVDWRPKVPAVDGALKAEVSKIAGLERLVGETLPLPMPLALSAKLGTSAGEQRVDPIQITLGKSTVQGRITLRTADPRPFVSAQLKSREVDLAPLADRGGAPKAPRERVFSEAPFPLQALHSFDAEAELAIDHLLLPNKLPVEAVRVRASLKQARLEARSVQATIAGGAVKGHAVLDAAKIKSPTLAVNLDGRGINLARMAAVLDARVASGGNTDVTVNLHGPGGSLHRFAGGANGELRVVIGPARITGGALTAGGGLLRNILDKADVYRQSDPSSDLKCAVVRLSVRDGIATSRRTIAYETTKVNMVVAGTINLGTEALDLAIRPTMKESLRGGAANLAELVRVTGTLSRPEIGIDTVASAKAALSVGGAVATGGISLLAESLLSRGTADRTPCQSALAESATVQNKADSPSRGPVGRLFK